MKYFKHFFFFILTKIRVWLFSIFCGKSREQASSSVFRFQSLCFPFSANGWPPRISYIINKEPIVPDPALLAGTTLKASGDGIRYLIPELIRAISVLRNRNLTQSGLQNGERGKIGSYNWRDMLQIRVSGMAESIKKIFFFIFWHCFLECWLCSPKLPSHVVEKTRHRTSLHFIH